MLYEGVDHADRLCTTYEVDIKSKKWWRRIFWGVLDIMSVNAFEVYKKCHETIPLIEIICLVGQGLISRKEF